jgi:hypothetical protein
MSMNLCKLSRFGRRIVAVFFIAAGSALVSAGQLDPTFLGTGMRVLPEGLGFVYLMSFAIQSDGKILLTGYGAPGQFLYRMQANGGCPTSRRAWPTSLPSCMARRRSTRHCRCVCRARANSPAWPGSAGTASASTPACLIILRQWSAENAKIREG